MAMTGLDGGASTAENYRRFGREAAGSSPTYERLALGVAEDAEVLGFLERLPTDKRQPNLLFAAARHLMQAVPDLDGLRRLVASRPEDLTAVMLTRRTQTNEPRRCATLLPALSTLEGPLAVIEVGASAGLCLRMDQYSYDYGHTQVAGLDPAAPTLPCELHGRPPTPRLPEVAWAAGLDLNPLDPADPADRAWLQCLVWPDQPERARRLTAALDTAGRHPVPVHRGDLVDDLPALVESAPAGTKVVVFHSAVLAYVEPARRTAFADLVDDLGVTWLANEAPGVVADVRPPARLGMPFVLTLDGEPVGYTQSHGARLEWIG